MKLSSTLLILTFASLFISFVAGGGRISFNSYEVNKYPPSGPNPQVPPQSHLELARAVNKYPPSGPNPQVPPQSHLELALAVNKYPPSGPNPQVPPQSHLELARAINVRAPSGPNPGQPPEAATVGRANKSGSD